MTDEEQPNVQQVDDKKSEDFYRLVEQFRDSTDERETALLGDQLGRLIFQA